MTNREVILNPIAEEDDTITVKTENGVLTIDAASTPIICSKDQAFALYLTLDMLYRDTFKDH